MGDELRVRLEGQTAELGRVAASDFARLLLFTQSAIQRAAGHVLGRQTRETGRPGRTIEDSTRLRLLCIERGSVVAVLQPPPRVEAEDRLTLPDEGLGELAIDSALATLLGEETSHHDVADVFVRMADEIGVGRRFDAITFERADQRRHVTARLDAPRRNQLCEIARPEPRAEDDTVVGVLVEADFESLTARLRTATGAKTTVSFAAGMADDIHEALRSNARLRGEVRYDPASAEARSIELHEIVRGDQLALGLDPGNFWLHRTIAEAASEAGVPPVDDVESLRDADASEDEVDRLLAALEDM
jgi:hypothetical protein